MDRLEAVHRSAGHFHWSAKGNSRVLLEQYNNSTSIRLSAQYNFKNDVKVRGGFAGVASAAPIHVTPLLPEQDRALLHRGCGAAVVQEPRARRELRPHQHAGPARRIDERIKTTRAHVELNSGVYTLSANVISSSLKASY